MTDGGVTALPPYPMVPAPFVVRKVRRETRDTFTFELLSKNTPVGLPFAPGQFTMLYVFGVGEVPLSITGDPSKPDLLVHTVRNVGIVTSAIARLKRGDMVGIRGPFGNPWPMEQANGKDILIVAGGLGLAPLRPVLFEILAHRAQYRSVSLLYGTRTPDDILYRNELEHWRSRLDLPVDVTVDRAPADWRGAVGVVTSLIPRASSTRSKPSP